MKTTLFTACSLLLTLAIACSDSGVRTSTNAGNATNTANANNPPNVANANNQSSAGNKEAAPEKTEAQRQLEIYVKEFLTKPIPQKISNNPQYKEKVAKFTKDGDDYIYNPYPGDLAPYYTESSADLRTIIVIDPGKGAVSAIDTTIPAVISTKKVNLSGASSEAQARYYYIVMVDKFLISVEDSLKKQSK